MARISAIFAFLFVFACAASKPVDPLRATVLYRSTPQLGMGVHGGWHRWPVALEIWNDQPYDVRAYVDCDYTHAEVVVRSAMSARVPLVLNDQHCEVEYYTKWGHR